MINFKKKEIIFLCCLILVIPIFLQFIKLQIIDSKKYKERAGKNSLRQIFLKASRGVIYDRNGVALVDNQEKFSIEITPNDMASEKFNYDIVESIIGLDKAYMDSIINYNMVEGRGAYIPFTLVKFLDFSKKIMLEEYKTELPGLRFVSNPVRNYVSDVSMPHTLGYLKTVTPDIVKEKNQGNEGYKYFNYDLYGYSGIEKKYEEILRGTHGWEYRLVNNVGLDQGKTMHTNHELPKKGNDVYLTIDSNLQIYAEKLIKGLVGTIICMDPETGEVLAMASSPDYDLKSFIGPVPLNVWNKWNFEIEKPLINRALSGTYAPGSLFKIIVASLILNSNQKDFISNCTGSYTYYDQVFSCWNIEGHGKMNLREAMKNSCNHYFYEAIQYFSFEEWVKEAQKFQFGKSTDIDLFNEKKGLIPNRDFLNNKYTSRGWSKGNLLLYSIGQGEVLTTPIQIINMINIIANNGLLHTPHINKDIEVDPIKINIKKSVLSKIADALYSAVNEYGGTGGKAYVSNGISRGKTGTAENPHGEPHSWFTGYVTANNKSKMSIVVLIENGGKGSDIAANISGKIFNYFSNSNRK